MASMEEFKQKFYSKKHKEQIRLQKEEELAEQRKNQEIQTKMRIRKTLRTMKSKAKQFDTMKQDYINSARNAELVNNKKACDLAKSGIKLCIARQRFLDSMIIQYETTLQMKGMNQVISEFIKTMKTMAIDLKGITSEKEIMETQDAMEEAMMNNEDQFEAIQDFISQAEESISNFAVDTSSISDEEIDELIHNQAADSESNLNADIDEQIKALREA